MHADPLEAARDASPRSLRVAVGSEDEVWGRRILGALIRGGLGDARCAMSMSDLLRSRSTEPLDVVVLRFERIRPDAVNSLGRASEPSETRVVLVVPTASAADVRDALSKGADGLVLESSLDASLSATVRAVASGQVVVPSTGRAQLAAAVLTSREKQVLGLVVMGFSNAESARRLHLAEATVKSHLRSSFKKLGVRTRSEACARILDPTSGVGLGILSISDGARPE